MNNNYKNDYHSPLKQAKLHFMLEKAPLENDEFFTFANQLAKLFPNERPDFSQFPEWVFLNTNIDQNATNPLYILSEWAKNKKYCEYLIHYIQPLIDSIQPQDLSHFTHFPCLQLKIVYFFIQNMSFFQYPEHPKWLKMYWESFYSFSKPFLSEATYLLNSPYSMDKIISVHILTYLLVWLNAISLLPSQDEILDVLGYITQLLLEKRPIFASQVGIQCLLYLIQNEFPQKYLPQFIPAVIQAASEPILPKVYQCIRLLLPYIQPEDFKTELKHFLFTQKFNNLNFICQNEYLELMSSIIQNLLFDYYPPIYWCTLGLDVFEKLFSSSNHPDNNFLKIIVQFLYLLYNTLLEIRQEIQKPPKPDYYIYFVNLIRKHIPNETVEANASLILNELRFYEDFPQKFSSIMGNVFDMNDIPYVEFDHLPEDISL